MPQKCLAWLVNIQWQVLYMIRWLAPCHRSKVKQEHLQDKMATLLECTKGSQNSKIFNQPAYCAWANRNKYVWKKSITFASSWEHLHVSYRKKWDSRYIWRLSNLFALVWSCNSQIMDNLCMNFITIQRGIIFNRKYVQSISIKYILQLFCYMTCHAQVEVGHPVHSISTTIPLLSKMTFPEKLQDF